MLATEETLADTLTRMWETGGGCPGEVVVLKRRANAYWSTFPSEVVTCRLPDGTTRKLLCKRARPDDRAHLAHGHRHGVAYEAAVYRDVLRHLPITTARYFGGADDDCLVIEYLDRAVRVMQGTGSLAGAAAWIGAFHRAAGSRHPALIRYDRAYYEGWLARFREFGRARLARTPWLRRVCDGYDAAIERLLAAEPVVIHGEFYPRNILLHRQSIYPVDWESAALAPGEIDLASLTEGWPPRKAEGWITVYAEARWPDGPPPAFAATLTAARVYLAFRWLGDRPDWTEEQGSRHLYRQLRAAGQQLGLV